jgi:hypothetical protein
MKNSVKQELARNRINVDYEAGKTILQTALNIQKKEKLLGDKPIRYF